MVTIFISLVLQIALSTRHLLLPTKSTCSNRHVVGRSCHIFDSCMRPGVNGREDEGSVINQKPRCDDAEKRLRHDHNVRLFRLEVQVPCSLPTWTNLVDKIQKDEDAEVAACIADGGHERNKRFVAPSNVASLVRIVG